MAHGSDYDMKLDNWAIGVLAFEFLTGKPPFDAQSETYYKLESIKKGDIRFPNFLSSEAKDFVMRLLEVDPRKRMDLRGAMAHPFLNKLNR